MWHLLKTKRVFDLSTAATANLEWKHLLHPITPRQMRPSARSSFLALQPNLRRLKMGIRFAEKLKVLPVVSAGRHNRRRYHLC